jgi:hypothetical protein
MVRWWNGVVIGCMALAVACGGAEPERRESIEQVEQRATEAVRFNVTVPSGVALNATFMAATELLRFDDRVELGDAGQLNALASFGTTTTHVAAGVKAHGNISSVAQVWIGSQATIDGFVRSRSTIETQAGAQILGARTPSTTVSGFETSWNVDWPTTNSGNVTRNAGQPGELNVVPGSYGQLNVHSNNKLRFKAGSYFFDSYNVEPQVQINVDTTEGQVFIYVKNSFTHKSPFSDAGGGPGRVLVGYRGTGTAYVEAPFVGTIVAPNGGIELRRPNVAGLHRGSFFGKRVQVFSDSKVQFLPFDWSFVCPLGDTDGDGASDCVDLCSRDASKTTPGACGCGHAETDGDLDGSPDCIEICTADGNNFSVGQCGCVGLPGLDPAGTPCTDGPCGPGVCDGAGSCGDRNSCKPEPNCVLKPYGASWYWFCPAATWQVAAQRCQSQPGRRLVRIDDRPENDFVARNVSAASWTGGNDLTAEGTWRWRVASGGDGDAFWQGSGAVSYRFTSWSGGSPSAPDCAAIGNGTGGWQSRECAEALPYVCEKNARTIDGGETEEIDWCKFFPSEICNELDDPPPGQEPDCVEQSSALPGSYAEFEAEVHACLECDQEDEDCNDFCSGATVPPADSDRCADWDPESYVSCRMTNVNLSFECSSHSQCSAGRVCAPHYDCMRCDEFGNCDDSAFCSGVKRCGTPIPTCAPAFDDEPCGDVEICITDDVVGESDPEANPDTDLTAEPVTPELFDGDDQDPLPPGYAGDPAPCEQSPCSDIRGEDHPWCKLGTEGTLPDQAVDDDKVGQSGNDSGIVQFDFDPNMDLTYKTTPLPFGVSRYDLSASASFSGKARFSFLGLRPEVEIIDAAAKVVADICHFSTDGTKLEVFGTDFLPELLGRSPVFDSNDVFSSADCQDALTELETLMDRAKKAMRDAQELIRQYKKLRDLGQEFSSDFCATVAADPEAGFPAGNCATETPRQTIERFRQHYLNRVSAVQAELEGLQEKVLSSATLPPEWRGIAIGGPNNEESQLIIQVPFAIGPIPMKLEIEAFLNYGIDGSINFEFAPTGLFSGGQQPVARVTANAIPNANASIRVFVGAGFGVNGFDASIGLEGSVTLGNVSVPLWAGVGIDVAAEPDTRTLPEEDAEVATGVLFPPGGASQYRFFLNYTYGANVDVTEILKGDLNARLRIKFFFFSKTWRKTIVSFPGIGSKSFKLFEGEGGASLGALPWGVVRVETPFLNLALPTTPPGPRAPDAPATRPFDPAPVEELFFDSLCTCQEVDEDCTRADDCCPGLDTCFGDPALGGRTVCSSCRALDQTCNDSDDCCSSAPNCLIAPGGDGIGRCSPCKQSGQACSEDGDCCSGGCVDNVCADCLPFGEPCQGREAGCCTKTSFTEEKMSCVTLSNNPEFTCWCQESGGACSGESADWQCCDPQATCEQNESGNFICVSPGPK